MNRVPSSSSITWSMICSADWPGDRRAAVGAVRLPDPRPEQAQVVVDLGDRADRRARVARGRLLVDRDRRRQPLDRVDVRLVHLAEELARVGGQRLDVAALALGVDRVEGERGLPGAGQAGDDHQRVARQLEGDVLQVVLTGAGDDDRVGWRHRHRCYTGEQTFVSAPAHAAPGRATLGMCAVPPPSSPAPASPSRPSPAGRARPAPPAPRRGPPPSAPSVALGRRRRRRERPRAQPRRVRARAAPRPLRSTSATSTRPGPRASSAPATTRSGARSPGAPSRRPATTSGATATPATGPTGARRPAAPCPTGAACRLGAGWELLSLNSEAPHGPGSAQLAWLAAATARPGTCRIAIWHRPRFSTGWHGDQADMAPALERAARPRPHRALRARPRPPALRRPRRAAPDRLRGRRAPEHPASRTGRARTVRFVDRLRTGGARLRLTRGRATIELVAAAAACSTAAPRPAGRSSRRARRRPRRSTRAASTPGKLSASTSTASSRPVPRVTRSNATSRAPSSAPSGASPPTGGSASGVGSACGSSLRRRGAARRPRTRRAHRWRRARAARAPRRAHARSRRAAGHALAHGLRERLELLLQRLEARASVSSRATSASGGRSVIDRQRTRACRPAAAHRRRRRRARHGRARRAPARARSGAIAVGHALPRGERGDDAPAHPAGGVLEALARAGGRARRDDDGARARRTTPRRDRPRSAAARAPHTVAPSSIIAWFQSAARPAGTSASRRPRARAARRRGARSCPRRRPARRRRTTRRPPPCTGRRRAARRRPSAVGGQPSRATTRHASCSRTARGVVAQAHPRGQDVRAAGVGERRLVRPALEPRLVARDDARDLRLLEHDLRDEDRVRVAWCARHGRSRRSRAYQSSSASCTAVSPR